MTKAVFIDRDGVINEDSGYVHTIDQFKILPRVVDALKLLQEKDYLLIVITGQSGIGRGMFSEEDFLKLNGYMINYFHQRDIDIKKTYYCPHHPDEDCACRKPKTKLLEDAAHDFDIDLPRSWVIGDKLSDIEMGEAAGCHTALIDSRYVRDVDRKKFKDLYEAALSIIETNKSI